MWDVDGREYIDFTMGYGTNLCGHSPSFVTEALAAQLARGIEIGPQSPLAGEVARLLCEFSGHGARRLLQHRLGGGHGRRARSPAPSRAATRIATCSGYHGIDR